MTTVRVLLVVVAPAPASTFVVLVVIGGLVGALVRVRMRVRRRAGLLRGLGDDPLRQPRQRVRWLAPPAAPSQAALDELGALLAQFPQIAEAWLARQAVTVAAGDEHEQVTLALALDDGSDSNAREAAGVLAELTKRASLRSLGIRNAILVNDMIRSATEQHGIKIYSRSTRS
jgi:hypothetical protein